MSQCVTYVVRNSLCVNMTNRCTCNCDFCERRHRNGVGDADSLWLEHEPAREEIWADIAARDLNVYNELLFCGFGEPTIRLDDLLWVAKKAKETMPSLSIRINTNGHASLIANRDVTPELAGIIDALNVSLNRADAARYTEHMKPIYGEAAYDGLLDFAAKAKNFVPSVALSVLDVLDEDELAQCMKIAERLGLPLRVRKYH